MPSLVALVKRATCYPRGDDPHAPIHPDRPACLSRDEEIAITVVGVICGLVTAWCVSVWVLWAWRSRKRRQRLLGPISPPQVFKGAFRTLSGSSGTPSPPSSQDHSAYPPGPLSEESAYSSLTSGPDMTPRPNEPRFSLPLLSARGDLLPDPAAVARLNRQASLPEAPARALPVPPAPQCASTTGFYEAGDAGLVPMSAGPVSPPQPTFEHAAFTNALVRSLIDSGMQAPSTPRGDAQDLEYRPYGYQAQTYSPVPGFTPKSRTALWTPGAETAPLMSNIAQAPSPSASPSRRAHNYAQVPSANSRGSPLASPTPSKSSRHSLLGSRKSPLSSSDSESLNSRRSPLGPRSTGSFPRAVSPTPRPLRAAAGYPLGAATPTIAPPVAPLILTPPARGSSRAIPNSQPTRPPRRLSGPAVGPSRTQMTSPLPAPKPVVPAIQLLSQSTMAMFDDFSDSSDGHTSAPSESQEQHDVNPCRQLFPVGRVGSKHLVFDRGQATVGSKRLPGRSEVVAAEGGPVERVVVHSPSAENLAASGHASVGDLR